MRKSGFKPRKTPMRRTAIKRKAPAAKSAKWYAEKVYQAFMKPYRGQPCAVCGNTHDHLGNISCAHHIVSQGHCPRHKVTPQMVIVLCPDCHRWAHGGGLGNGKSANAFKIVKFMEWLKENHREQHDWCKLHQADTANNCGKIPWKELYEANNG